MAEVEIITKSEKQTEKTARILAGEIQNNKKHKKQAEIIALTGELGAGKTVFTRGFARGLGIKNRVFSPTFVLIKRHSLKNSYFENFYHIDCYRIKKAKEISDLGWKEIAKNPKNILVIEWADKIKKILPKNSLKIQMKHKDRTKRIIIL
ncbi:tRNA (adenosine(37)-N6)-threonylcarbamoyltransferase complex ATPase subunit type 1 TsaE [Patescibacteria group bacterium]